MASNYPVSPSFHSLRHGALTLLVSSGLLLNVAHGQVITDTTLGKSSQTLSGPNYNITESLGKLSGNNLFHSFQKFNVNTGENAIFTTTTPTIKNVISRVTGGSASTINGSIFMVPADGLPAFYFINPAGVIFGAGAYIDVPGGIHVSTADYIRFPDGRFYASPDKASTLSSASPEAFGFVGKKSVPLTLSAGADLWAYQDKDISLIAGDITIDDARVKSDGGRIRLGAMGTQTVEVPFSGELPAGTGQLKITDSGLATVTGSCCGLTGTIKVTAGDVLIDGQDGSANSTGIFGSTTNFDGAAAAIDIAAKNSFVLQNGGTVRAVSLTDGTGGSVSINSPKVSIDNAKIDVSSLSSGNAGSVDISGTTVKLTNGGQIWAAGTESTGGAGVVRIDASKSIEIGQKNLAGDRSLIDIQTIYDVPPGKVELKAPFIRLFDDGMIDGYSSSSGVAGQIDITTKNLVLENGGNIYTYGLYAEGGTVTINASDSITIRGKNEALNSSPGADTVSTGIIGHGTQVFINSPKISISESGAIRAENWYRASPGLIDISTKYLTLQSGGHISAQALGHSYTQGKGGEITIQADNFVKVIGTSGNRNSSIASGTRSSNDAGRITITTPWLYVADLGLINTSTGRFGEAGAGRIDIIVDRLEINGGRLASIEFGHTASGGHINVTARESISLINGGKIIAQGGNEAAAGRISLTAPSISLNKGLISTSNDEYATSGGIEIIADRLFLGNASRIEANSTSDYGAGNIDLHVDDLTYLTNSSITTTSYSGSGGNVSLNGHGTGSKAKTLVLRNSLITTSVLGATGDGGDISINARTLAMDTGFIQANTVANNASGGVIDINASSLIPSGNILFVGGQTPYTFKSGIPNFNVIQAAAPTGISGTINISAPALDISGSLISLTPQMIEVGNLGRSPCHTTGGSSLVQIGRGGFPPAARNLLGTDTPVSYREVPLVQENIPWYPQRYAMPRTACLKG